VLSVIPTVSDKPGDVGTTGKDIMDVMRNLRDTYVGDSDKNEEKVEPPPPIKTTVDAETQTELSSRDIAKIETELRLSTSEISSLTSRHLTLKNVETENKLLTNKVKSLEGKLRKVVKRYKSVEGELRGVKEKGVVEGFFGGEREGEM